MAGSAAISRRMRFAVPITIVATAALGVAGCGSHSSASSVAPATWVHDLCTDLHPFLTTAQTGEKQLAKEAEGLASSGKLAALKDDLLGFVRSVDIAATSAKSKLAALGPPNVAGGAKLKSEIVTVMGNASAALTQAEGKVAKLSTTSAQSFGSAATQLGSSLQSSLSNAGHVLPSSAGKSLKPYAVKDPACTFLHP